MRKLLHLSACHAPSIWDYSIRIFEVKFAAERAFVRWWKFVLVGTAAIGLQINGTGFVKELAVRWCKKFHNVEHGLTRSLSELVAKIDFTLWIQDSSSVWTNGALTATIRSHVERSVGSHLAIGSEVATVIGNLGAKIVLILQASESGARDSVVGKGHVASVGTERAVGLEERMNQLNARRNRSEFEVVGMKLMDGDGWCQNCNDEPQKRQRLPKGVEKGERETGS